MIRSPFLLAALLALSACGQDEIAADASADSTLGGDVVDETTPDSASDASLFDRQPPTYNIVDGGGDDPACYRSYPTSPVERACCNGQLCAGFCIGEGDGAVSCSCYGITGGCWPGTECCDHGQGCLPFGECEGIPPGP